MDLSPLPVEVEHGDGDAPLVARDGVREGRLPRTPQAGLAPPLNHIRFRFYVGLAVADQLILLASFGLANALYFATALNNEDMLPGYLLAPLFLTLALMNECYSRESMARWKLAAGKLLMALLVSSTFLSFFAFFAKMNAEFSRVAFASALVLSMILMTSLRFAVSRWCRKHFGASILNRLVIQAGGPPVAIAESYRIDAKVHGLVPDLDDPRQLDRLARYLHNMDEVIVSCAPEDRLAWSLVLKGTGLHGEVISNFAREIGALGIVHHDDANVSGLLISSGQLGIRARFIKRIFDLFLSFLALVILAPIFVVCAILIKLEDGGPVFFKQRRVGRGNKFFQIYKFRSMRLSAEGVDGSVSTSREDQRITRIGRVLRRTSIDEMPQLINVLKGDMSLVGPRPHALGSLAGTKTFWQVDSRYWQRHSLRPGITGLAQVRGFRGATDLEADLSNRLRSDLEYTCDWSLWIDISIIIRTLFVLKHDRAY